MIKIGIIGAGYWGPNLIRNFAQIHNVSIEYVADNQPGRRQFVKDNFPNIQVVENADIIINDNDITLVVIVTPVNTHFHLAEKALSAGKHIFIEKPFTNSTADAEKLNALAVKNSLKIGVGHLFTFHPAIEQIHEFINTTEEFKPYYFISNRANLRPPLSKDNVIWDLAVHDFSIANYLFGEFPVSVYATANDYSGKGLDDMAVIQLTYPGKKKAVIHVSWHTPNKIRKFEMYGSKWSIFFDDMAEQKVRFFDEGIDTRIGADKQTSTKFEYKPGVILTPEIKNIQPLFNECQSFLDSVVTGTSFRNDGLQGLWAVKMCELAEESAKEGKEINFT
ncbi:MAG: Gfo/Idh/MocA family oxidoreductase [Nitrospirae bacterium]|nr:Gfo/Idh/MocA family oxidoreductase [Nitrospirota bacterium]